MSDFIYDYVMPVTIVLALIGVIMGVAILGIWLVKAVSYSFDAVHCSEGYGWFDFGEAGRLMTDVEYKEFCEK